MQLFIGLIAAVIVLAVAALVALRTIDRNFSARMDNLKNQLTATQTVAVDDAARPELPDIVRDYAVRAGGREGAALVFHARHKATLATARGAPPLAIEAEQWTGIAVPGLVWIARGRMRGIPVVVFDAFVAGRGELRARLLGAFEVAGGAGADYDKGELMRYLSELPVYPDAILNLAGVIWRQLDDRTVSVTAHSATGEATVRFIFDETGDIVGLEADDRPMAVDGITVATPWHGKYARYARFGRYRIPTYGEVGWLLPDGLFVYWKGEVVHYAPSGEDMPAGR